MKVVVDTNVTVSAAFSATSAPRRALLRLIERETVAASDAMVAEWREVLARPDLARWVSADVAADLLDALLADIRLVVPTITVRDCRDPKDDKVLECALEARADLIVSGEGNLLVLHPWRGIPILSPADDLAS